MVWYLVWAWQNILLELNFILLSQGLNRGLPATSLTWGGEGSTTLSTILRKEGFFMCYVSYLTKNSWGCFLILKSFTEKERNGKNRIVNGKLEKDLAPSWFRPCFCHGFVLNYRLVEVWYSDVSCIRTSGIWIMTVHYSFCWNMFLCIWLDHFFPELNIQVFCVNPFFCHSEWAYVWNKKFLSDLNILRSGTKKWNFWNCLPLNFVT